MTDVMSRVEAPHFAVILATRNRPEFAQRAARSILTCKYLNFQLIVVDQSSNRQTETRIGLLSDDPRVIYAAHQGKGLSAGRNFGARIARQLGADWLVFTDDDCEAQADWLTAIRHAVAFDPEIALLFGAAVAGDYDRTKGMIPAYRPERFRMAEGIATKCRIDGIGASMALRMDAWSRLGGFDELLGAGAPFCSAEETDITVRTLLAGYKVCETPDAVVVHHGFRSWPECPALIAGYMYGIGAAMTKMVRLGGGRALLPLAGLAWRWAWGTPKVDLNHQPPRLARLAAFLRGGKAAARMGLTRDGVLEANSQETAGLAEFRNSTVSTQERKRAAFERGEAEEPRELGANL